MYKILFVCSGNTCRSPLAEALLNKAVENDPQLKGNVIVSSCGTATHYEDTVQPNAVEAGAKLGVDLAGYKSRQFAPELADMFDVIIGMSKSHRDIIVARFPQLKEKTFALYEYTTGEKDCKNVQDPFGCGIDVYDKVAEEINQQVQLMLMKIKENM